jgi:hypothetical protein
LLLDLQFLKCCRFEDVIPRFLWFKTANEGLKMSSIYKECQRRLLKAEMNSKYREVNILKNDYYYFLNELKKYIPDNVFQHILNYIFNRSRAVLYVKETNLEEKFNSLKQCEKKTYPVDRNVVKNLSSRVLSEEEADCLAHGLDMVFFLNMLMILTSLVILKMFFIKLLVFRINIKNLCPNLMIKLHLLILIFVYLMQMK